MKNNRTNMLVDLIVDGNFLLSRMVFTLHKNNLLYGSLHKSLEVAINNYRKWYPFANVYFVSDSKEKSWRKQIYQEYKGTRKKDSDIDWNFVYNAYGEFKDSIKGFLKVMEAPHIEGDDWISFLSNKANSEGRSTFIVSNDYDIKQLVFYSLNPLYINIMTNEMFNKEKLFLPKNYQIFLSGVRNLPNNDIFNLNDNKEFLILIDRFLNKYEINEIDSTESLMIKIISGDKGDNIDSVFKQVKNGKTRGIGEKGAKTIYDDYIMEFGEPNLYDPDLYENIADIICEKKKLSKSSISDIVENIKGNVKLIDLRLHNLPDNIIEKMNNVYDNK
jgi:5'-3' exonuclease